MPRSGELRAGPAAVSGNGVVLEMKSGRRGWTVEFMAEPRSSPEPLWFHLECEGAGERAVRFVWRNADGCLGLHRRRDLRNVRPVIRLDEGNWQRVERVRVLKRPAGGHELSFRTPAPCERVAAAFCYPYGLRELAQTIGETGDAWQREPIGLSGEGRPLLRLQGPAGTEGAQSAGVCVIARQHAGETPGSWALDGVLRAVAASDGGVLRRVAWWVVPFVDVDGVVRGDYGKDAQPVDFNRAWSAQPMRPEVLALQRDLRRFAALHRRRLLLDLHAPGGGERSFYQYLPREGRPEEQRRAAGALASRLSASMEPFGTRPSVLVPDYPSRWDVNHTVTCWCWDWLDETPGVCIETPYQAIGDGAWPTPDDYRKLGRGIARGVAAWLREG
jgi:hypothetical protein